MTEEELESIAETECKKLLQSEKGYNGISFQEFWAEGAKWGLAEGRKESKEYIRYLKRQRQGGIQKQYNKIEKINELKGQIEKMKCCLNCKKWRYFENYPLCAEKAHFIACELWEMKE